MSREPIKIILLVEDSGGDARLLQEMLAEQGTHNIALTHVECLRDAETYLAQHSADMILLDLGLPDGQGIESLKRTRKIAPGIPLIVLTGRDDGSMAEQSLQEGAQDYLIKGQIDQRGLLQAIRYATERKRLERLKDEFVSTVSHELRTPLTSIFGSLALLKANAAGKLPDAALRLIGIAHRNCERLVRLVNDILDIEKMESGLVAYNFQHVEARSLLEQAIEANRDLADAHKVQIRLDPACPAADVRADADRLTQVVTNLFSNAIKFSPPGSEVVVAIENGGEMVRITVRDYGSGIPDNFKPLIFEKFAQADATNARQKGGTGLGLSIVREIVGRLGGMVGFDDAPGGGTIFHVDLPRWQDLAGSGDNPVAVPQALRTPRPQSDLIDPAKRPRILYVDEDNAVVQALSAIADVVSVKSIEEAQHMLNVDDFDLAVLNTAAASAPELDGPLELRDRGGRAIPVVAVSKHDQNARCDPRTPAAQTKSQAPIDRLIETVCERLASGLQGASAWLV
jgi:signal transduction histidine kinase